MTAEDRTTGKKNKITITNDKGRLRWVCESEEDSSGTQGGAAAAVLAARRSMLTSWACGWA